MNTFNSIEFGDKIRKARLSKGLSTDNLAKMLNKSQSMIVRYEKGQVLPDIETVCLLCDKLEISYTDLFNETKKISNTDMSINPFSVETLYLYYRAYFPIKKKFGDGKFKLQIRNDKDICKVDFLDYKTDKIYLSGYLLADGNIAVFVLENYKPNSPRLEVTEIILNISNSMDRLMIGTLYCTNGKYIPSIRKCAVSKEDLEFNEDIRKQLRISETEKEQLQNEDVLHIELENKDDFEQ